MTRSSPIIGLLMVFHIFLITRCGGDTPFLPKIKTGETRDSNHRPPNNDTNTPNPSGLSLRFPAQFQPIPLSNSGVFGNLRSPVRNFHQSDLGLSQLSRSQRESSNDGQSTLGLTHRRHLISSRANAEREKKEVNTNDDPPVEDSQEEKLNRESHNDDIGANTNTDNKTTFKVQNKTPLQFRNRFYKHQQPPREKPPTDQPNEPNPNNVLMTKEKEPLSDIAENLVSDSEKSSEFEPNPVAKIISSQKKQPSKVFDAGPRKTILNIKRNSKLKNERNDFQSPFENETDFQSSKEELDTQFGSTSNFKPRRIQPKLKSLPAEKIKMFPSPFNQPIQTIDADEVVEDKINENADEIVGDDVDEVVEDKINEHLDEIADDNINEHVDDNVGGNVDDKVDTSVKKQKDQGENDPDPSQQAKADNKINQTLNSSQNEQELPKATATDFKSIPIDQAFSTRPRQRSYKILYDETFLHLTLKLIGKLNYLDRIKDLVKRLDIYIDNFLKTTVMEVPKIPVNRNFNQCEILLDSTHFNIDRKYFKKNYSVEGDVLIYLHAWDDPRDKSIAASKACSYHLGMKDPVIASMRFNIAQIFPNDKPSDLQQIISLDSAVHEMLHIFGFDQVRTENLLYYVEKNEDDYPNLAKLNTDQVHLFDELNSHWNPDVLTNELMTPTSSQEKLLSIFSMEYVDLMSRRTRTRRDIFTNNPLLDRITDFSDYLGYKCQNSDKVSKYPNFCSLKEVVEGQITCGDYFTNRYVCEEKMTSNFCFKKSTHIRLTCVDEKNVVEGLPFETFGQDSRCFMVGDKGRCFATSVRNERVFVSGSFGEVECSKSGQIIPIEFEDPVGTKSYKSTEITCPDLNEFIKAYKKTRCMKGCYGNGICKDGVCHCLEGFDPNSHCKNALFQHKPAVFVTIPYNIE